jgi:RHS repeat-associated protein
MDDLAADVRDLANQPPVVRYVNLLVRDAHDAGASDVHLEATRGGLAARFRLDGVLVPAPEPPAALHHAVVSRIKLLAELDIAERRRPQDGRIRVRLEARELDLRVSTVPTSFGESVVLRLLDRGGRPVGLDDLGMPPLVLQQVSELAARPHGLVLVTGSPTLKLTTRIVAKNLPPSCYPSWGCWDPGPPGHMVFRYRIPTQSGERLEELRATADDEGRLKAVYNSMGTILTTWTERHAPLAQSFDVPMGLNASMDSLWRGYTYDSTKRITGIARRSGAAYSVTSYAYDELARLREVTTADATSCGLVDSVVGFSCSGGSLQMTQTLDYDEAGNRTDDPASHVTTGNRVTRFKGDSLLYDADGNVLKRINLVTGAVADYTWSAAGRLMGITMPGKAYAFGYDPAGRLVTVDVNGVPTRTLLWFGNELIAELDGAANTRITEYLYQRGGLEPFAAVMGNGDSVRVAFLWYDALNRLTNAVDVCPSCGPYGAPAVRQTLTADFDAWGKPTFGGMDAGKIGRVWKSSVWIDSTAGIYYMGHRWYDPRSGRFLTQDPAGTRAGLNAYAYGRNDPVNRSDPSGLWDVCLWNICIGSQDDVADNGCVGQINIGSAIGIGAGCTDDIDNFDNGYDDERTQFNDTMDWWSAYATDLYESGQSIASSAYDVLDNFDISVKASVGPAEGTATITPANGHGSLSAGVTKPTSLAEVKAEIKYNFRDPVGSVVDIGACYVRCIGISVDNDGIQGIKGGAGITAKAWPGVNPALIPDWGIDVSPPPIWEYKW